MRPRHLRTVALALALLGCAPCLSWAISGRIVYLEGDVAVLSGGDSRSAQIGDAIQQGDTVSTAALSLAVLDLANGTTVKLREKTTLAIDTLGDSAAVTLKAGGVFTSIAHHLVGTFDVKASNAIAGVRGTQFFVAYGRTIDAMPDLWLCVQEGSVQVDLPTAGQTVVVPAGRGITIVGGARLTVPRRYPWTRKLNWNVDPAAGSVVDRTSLDDAYLDLLNQDYD